MAVYIHKNALDQALDVAGSLLQQGSRTLQDEPDGVGRSVSGSTTTSASFSAPVANVQTVSGPGLVFYIDSPGRYVRISGAGLSAGNVGTFLITSATLPATASIYNAAGVAEGPISGTVVDERYDYSLEDDINFARTDRRAIKGTLNFYDGIPTYERPTAVGTSVTASLQNIAGKTTDAKALVTSRVFLTASIVSGAFYTTLTGTGIFQFADAVDRTGVPIDDGADAGAFEATYVDIIDRATEAGLEVLSGSDIGQRIFGVTFGSSGSEPNVVGVKFMKVADGLAASAGVPYAWESGHPLVVQMHYGYRQRIDQLDDAALRRTLVNGIISDADMSHDIVEIRRVIDDGLADNSTSLAGLLTNTGANFLFFNLPDATPSVVEALNTLNAQVGDRTYTGGVLTSGQTIAASLQALANSTATKTGMRRIIERLAADASAGSPHVVPGGYMYTPTATSGSGMLVLFWRGALRDPGLPVNSDDYEETSTGSFTPYSKIKSGDHINYLITV